ncbi:MAG: hypothetical protein M3Q30_18150, partial [Actinomycetota bacterium]|nr:hypothetical protein [Actinomycetota bacterium]
SESRSAEDFTPVWPTPRVTIRASLRRRASIVDHPLGRDWGHDGLVRPVVVQRCRVDVGPIVRHRGVPTYGVLYVTST